MSLQNVFEIDVDIKQKTAIRSVTVTQNDAVVFVFRIFDEGRIYNIQDGSTFTMTSTRPDKESVMTIGEVTGENVIQFELGTTEIAIAGKVETVIQLYDANGRVSTIPFSFNVLNDPTVDYVPSEDEHTLIQKVLGEGPAILADAEKATVDANTAATNANEKAGLAQTAADDANTAANNANGAANNANEKALLAEEKSSLADTAAQGANTAKIAAETATQEAHEATNAINLVLPNVEGLEYIEPYNAATAYSKNNIVSHEGSSFISLVDANLGNTPSLTPNVYWGVLARKGTDGLGSVVTVNGIGPNENGDVTITIPDPDLSELATKQELNTLDENVSRHLAEKATITELGHVMVDGVTINVDENGVISGSTGMTEEERTKLTNAQLFKLTRDTGANLQINDFQTAPVSFDDIKTPGEYYLGQGLTNHPLGATGNTNGFLKVRNISTNHVLQEWNSLLGTPRKFVRAYYNGWSAWIELASTLDYIPYIPVSAGTYDLEADSAIKIYKKTSSPTGELIIRSVVGDVAMGSIIRIINDGDGGTVRFKYGNNIYLGSSSVGADATFNVKFGFVDLINGGGGTWHLSRPANPS